MRRKGRARLASHLRLRARRVAGQRAGGRPLVSAAPPPAAPGESGAFGSTARFQQRSFDRLQIYTLQGETNNIRFPRVTLLRRSTAVRPPVRPRLA